MSNEPIDYLFSVLQANLQSGMDPKEAWDDAVLETIDVFYSDAMENAKEDKFEKKLTEMSDAELQKACAQAQARLHLSEKELKSRKKKYGGGGLN